MRLKILNLSIKQDKFRTHFPISFGYAAIPINKQLYSISYVCFTAGAAGIVFSGFYILVKIRAQSFLAKLSYNSLSVVPYVLQWNSPAWLY